MTFSSHGKEDDISNNRTWMTISIIERGRGGGEEEEVGGQWNHLKMTAADEFVKKGKLKCRNERRKKRGHWFIFCCVLFLWTVFLDLWSSLNYYWVCLFIVVFLFLFLLLNSWDDIYPTPSLISWYRPRVCNDYLLFVTMPIAKKSRLFFNISHHITHDYIF